MKKYSLIILVLTMLAICAVSFADIVQIGTGTATTSYLPIYGFYGYNYTQQIYTQAQINKAGNITKLRFFYVSGTITNCKDWVIYMGHTTKTAFSSTTDWEPLASLTEVFAGDVSSYVPLANNWMEIPLTTPFNYNNTDNLVIAVDENTSGYASMSWGAFTSGSNTGIYYYNDSTNPDPASPPTASSRTGTIDRIQLVFPNSSAPLAPTLLSPLNGGWALTNDILSWTPTSGAGDTNAYDVYFGTSTNPPLVSSNQAATTYTPTLIAGTTYYWKVVAKNEIGDSPASDVWSFSTAAEGTIQIGTGTSTQRQPFGVYFGYERSAALYTNAQIGNYGLLDQVAWNCATTSTAAVPYKIYAMQTNDTALTAMSWDTFTASATLVDEGTHTFSTTGWHLFELDNPISYVFGNLIVAVETNYGGGGFSSYPYFYYSTGATNSHQYWNQDSNPPTGTGSLNTYVPNIVLHLSELPTNPNISVTPSIWNFGQTIINTTKTKDFTISNTGGGTLNVSSIAIAGAYYTLLTNPAPVGLTSGQSATFTVQYAPTAVGTHNGAVTITDNRGTTTVDLSAVCYDPTISTFPWVEDFGTTTNFPPLNWSRLTGLYPSETPATTTSGWTYDDFANVVTTPQNMSGRLNIYYTSTKYWLVTPPIAIPGAGYELKFDLALTTYSGVATPPTPGAQPDDRFIVLISDSPMMTNPTVLREWNNTGSTYVYDNISPSGENHIISLNTYSGTKYLAFYGESTVSGGDNNVYVDNVTVRETPAAPIFSYTPASINFGSVQQNHPATPVNVIVTNTGGGTLNLSSSNISITGPNAAMFSFSSTNLPAALGAGQSVNIPVSVTVTQEGPVSATLSINYNSTNYDVALSAEGLPAGTVIIGTGTSTQRQPFGTLWGYERSAALYTNAQIGGYGLLDKVAWNCAATTTTVVPYKIYAMQTSDTAFTAMSWNTFTASATLVDEGTHIFSTTGWHLFELDTPFSYVSGNLIVAVETYYGGSGGGSGHTFYYSTGAANSHQYWYADTTPPTGTGTLNTSLPNIMLQFGELPSGPPDPVTLTYPANGAVGLPKTGFNLTWTRALTGGAPSYYVVYMSQDETTIYDDYYWETTNTHFNPVTDPAPESRITFNYLDRWYWTVEAVNDDGNAVVDPPYSFEIRQAPTAISTFPWTENFDAALTLPTDWRMVDVDGAGTYWQGSTAYSHSSPNSFMHSYSTAVSEGQNGWLITPAVQVPATGNYVISWWNYNVYPDWMVYNGLKVNTTDDPNDPNWVELWAPTTVTAAWSNAVVNITPYAGQTVYFAFNYQGYDADNWYIDDVSIYELLVDEFPPTITHLPVLNTPRTDINYLVYAEIADDPSWNNPIGGANLYYSIDSGTTWSAPIAMTPGTAPAYTAYIPAQPLETTIEYYLEAWDSEMNMATTDTYSFSVNNPTWIYYDTGGTTYLGYTGYIFGPTVLYENPFYGTGIPLKLLVTDGASYYATTANLHIYSFDGETMTDLITPLSVSFTAQTYQTVDLSSYDINITTPYFLIAYEDIPAGNYFLFDETYDYGTTFVKIQGSLYTLSNSGSWCIGAYVTNGISGIEAPVVTIANVSGNPVLSWNAVSGAIGYKVWGASDPYAPDPWSQIEYTTGTTYTYLGTDDKKFFQVTALTEAPAKGSRRLNSVSLRNKNHFGLANSSIQPVNAPKTIIEKRVKK